MNLGLVLTAACCVLTAVASADEQELTRESVVIGSRLELFVDDHLIDRLSGDARLTLHHPTPRELVMIHDQPWEGTGSGYHSVFQDGNRYRMYYKAWHLACVGRQG